MGRNVLERTLRSFRDSGYWPVKVDQGSETDFSLTIPDGRVITIRLDGTYAILTPVGERVAVEIVPSSRMLMKTLRGNQKRDYIKIHYAVQGSAICRIQRGTYTDTMLSEILHDVTCLRCLREIKSRDEITGKTESSSKQKADADVSREAVPGLLPAPE